MIDQPEPAADADDDVLADYLAAAADRSPQAPAEPPWPDRPELCARARRLVESVSVLHRCAANVWEFSTGSYEALPGGPGLQPGDDPFPGEYRLVQLLGQGGCGEVWLADDLNLHRQVALKTLRPVGDSGRAARHLADLRRDAAMLANFRHPHITQVFGWRTSGQRHFLVMRYCAGGSLADRLKAAPDGRLDWATAAGYVADVGDGLGEVHKQGVIHRDIKPGNILWDQERDEVLLTDFGIAAHQTGPADVGGTPPYMAPDAYLAQPCPEHDVYSLAATLFCLITGVPPFPGKNSEEIRPQSLAGLPTPDPRCAGLPEPIERLIRAGLSADPTRRPTLPAFVTALRGELNRLMADAISTPVPAPLSAATTPASLRLSVSHAGRAAVAERPVAPRTRDIKRVPPPPPRVMLRTGDAIEIEVACDQNGFLTVFNIGPTGNLDLLYPETPPQAGDPPNARAGVPVRIDGLIVSEPAGRERVFAVWSRTPLPLTPESLRSLAAESRPGAPKAAVATRDIRRVKQAVADLDPRAWRAEVLELDHEAPAAGGVP